MRSKILRRLFIVKHHDSKASFLSNFLFKINTKRNADKQFKQIVNTIDLTKFQAIWKKHDNPVQFKKYGDINYRVKLNLTHALYLRLDQKPPLDILDVGCGYGYFSLVSKYFGHNCIGFDKNETPLHKDIFDLWGCKHIGHRINEDQVLPPLEQQFDLITAFLITFHQNPDGTLWNAAKWRTFLQALKPALKPGGEIFFHLNALDGRYYSKEVFQYFVSIDAHVFGSYVWIKANNI